MKQAAHLSEPMSAKDYGLLLIAWLTLLSAREYGGCRLGLKLHPSLWLLSWQHTSTGLLHMFDEIDMIHSYSRADAIADSNLVDVSERAMKADDNMMGFKVPVAMTAAA